MTAMTDKQTQTAQEARQLRQRRRLSDGARTLFHYVLLTTILLIVVVPLMWAVAASFTPNEQVFRYVFPFSWRALFPSDPTLDAYLNLFQLRDFGGAIANTLALSVGTVAVGPLVVAPAPELRVVQVAVSLAVESRQTIWNELMAGAILAASVPVLLVFPFQRYSVRSIASTGIK